MKRVYFLIVFQLMALLAWCEPRPVAVTIGSVSVTGNIRVALNPSAEGGGLAETKLTLGEPHSYRVRLENERLSEFWDSQEFKLALTKFSDWDVLSHPESQLSDPNAPFVRIELGGQGAASQSYLLSTSKYSQSRQFLGWLFHSSVVGEQLAALPEADKRGIVGQFIEQLDEL